MVVYCQIIELYFRCYMPQSSCVWKQTALVIPLSFVNPMTYLIHERLYSGRCKNSCNAFGLAIYIAPIVCMYY